ncbi:MAG: Planctomycete cytochrome, partial [Verrucomicrobiales bacterium]|nr:Planctomycete cytochrome [Verrucomicrobiales bacterium]
MTLRAFTFVFALSMASLSAATPKLSYNSDIRPILADHCFTCHGQDNGARKSKLRLDDRDAALKGGESGDAAIVPGKPDASMLVKRILAHDTDDLMPPEKVKNPLKPEQIEKLRQWVAQGAQYQPHWAFIPPQLAILPKGAKGNPVDSLVASRLAKAKLKPSPEALPEVLCRRLWLDIVGLPPSPTEIDDFLAAWKKNRETAYHSLVEQLLASPRYGEKWARHWLDVARYADSDGYEKDLPRQQWAWRDWVIRSLNSDMPYSQFIIEQVAGDLLPNATQDQIVATGYLRNSMVSEEGAIIAEQYRMEGMFDRMDALGKGVIGLTVQCAQCHTHKFDPITHDEYYKMFAALNDTYEATSRVYFPEKLATIERVKVGIADAEAQIKSKNPDWQQRLSSWAAEIKALSPAWETVVPSEPDWDDGLVHPQVMSDNSIISLGFRGNKGDLTFTTKQKVSGVTGVRLEALTHGDLIYGGPGRNINGLFAVAEFSVEAQYPGQKEWKKLLLSNASSDFESPERPIGEPFRKDDKDMRKLGPSSFLVDTNKETAWSPDRGPGRRNVPTEVVMQFKEQQFLPEGTKLRCTLQFNHAGKDGHGRENNLLGRFRVAFTTDLNPHASSIPTEARLALETPEDKRTPVQQAAIFAAWRAVVPELTEANKEIEKLWAQYPEADTSILHLSERSAQDARKTFLLDRGSWDKPKHEVTPGTPAFLQPMAATKEPSRLVFAKWLVDPKSPTAARVEVNRVWQALFGQGLIERPEDFGVRTNPPQQPEVLDWLAVEFMDGGWSQKQLIRAIVSSKTYRQSSAVTTELEERDPKNMLLARGPRFRAEAEVIRDIALRTSGLLTEKIGGPSIFPPMPPSVMSASFLSVDFWKTATGPERYRRSLYVFRRRSMPDPVMMSFDAPNGDTACAGRVRSNSPLAALASLNETVFVEASQALALRILKEGGATDPERAAYGFRLCTGRMAQPDDVKDIVQLLKSRRERLSQGWLSAREITTGDPAKLPTLPA